MPALHKEKLNLHEARGYWKSIQTSMPVVLLVSLIAAVGALGIVRTIGPTYEVHFSYLISLNSRDEASSAFRFDGYYAMSAIDLFAQTLAGWIESPEVIVASLERAGISARLWNARTLSKIVQARRVAPQLVQVTVQYRSEGDADAIAEALQQLMRENVDRYHDEGTPALIFRVVPTESWTGVNELSAPVITVATFVLTFFIAINIVLLLEGMKRQSLF